MKGIYFCMVLKKLTENLVFNLGYNFKWIDNVDKIEGKTVTCSIILDNNVSNI